MTFTLPKANLSRSEVDRILQSIRRGCASDREQQLLLRQFEPLVTKEAYRELARYGANYRGELDDLLQSARLGLLTAVKRWKPAKGDFALCACYWVRKYVKRETEQNSFAVSGELLDEPAPHDGLDGVDYCFLMKLRHELPEGERLILDAMMAGEKGESLASELGMSVQGLKNIENRIREKIKWSMVRGSVSMELAN